MHRARQHAETRTRERRQRLAHEAAKVMAESGIRDFHQAKRKAAQRLGMAEDAELPRNREIDDALREYQRLFQRSSTTAEHLRVARQAAIDAMRFFAAFQPRLTGAVLEGTADAHSPVQLQLHSDAPFEIAAFLQEHGIPAESRMRRFRLDRHRSTDVDVWLFSADGVSFDLSVLPLDALRQAPLSPVDEKPQRRASIAQLQELLLQEDLADYDAG